LLLGLTSCGSAAEVPQDSSVPGGNAASVAALPSDANAAPSTQIAGQLLAHVDLNANHTVEFWELQPGNVALIQNFNSAGGEQLVELEPLLASRGGYSGLYRALLNDDHAQLPAELVAADERFHHLPIRDGFAPLPSGPPDATGTVGKAVAVNAAPPPVRAPGTLSIQAVSPGNNTSPGTAANFGFQCGGLNWDGGFCPGWSSQTSETGFFGGFANGNVVEAIAWTAIGSNPQSGSTSNSSLWDTFNVNQWINGAWVSVVHVGVPPGWSSWSSIGYLPQWYQGSITGNLIGYGENFRLSFPSLTQLPSHPLWVGNSFANDINGITHTSSSWILLRTEEGGAFSGFTTAQGCLGLLGLTTDLTTDPGRCPVYLTNNSGYNHFGDSVFDPVTAKLYVSLNQTNGVNGAIGVFSLDSTLSRITGYNGYTVIAPNQGEAWVALNPKALTPSSREFYTSDPSGTVIHQNQVFVGSSVTSTAQYNISIQNFLNNWATLNIQGGKVSSHGKLWVYNAASSTEHQILGIDPYSGVVAMKVSLSIDQGPWCTWACSGEEAEGLDITPTNLNAPGVSGQIHVQDLGNNASANDQWTLSNFSVSDLSRL
jgi:hypothetical protein